MKELLRGVTVPGVKGFAEEYLRRPFVGRGEALRALDAWYQNEAAPLLVCAEAGRGKSALLLRWAVQQAAAGAQVAWAPLSLRFGTARGAALDEALYGRLQQLSPDEQRRHWTDLLRHWPEDKALLLIIDGLDEALEPSMEAALRELRAPPSVRVIVAARRGVGREVSDWGARLGWRAFSSLLLGPLAREELKALLGGRFAGDSFGRMYRATGGDPLLVSLYLEQGGVEGGGLEALFDSWWREQERSWRQHGEDLSALTQALVKVFACALGSIEEETLSQLVGAASLEKALAPLGRFIVKTPEGYVFSHPRLNDFFRERLTSAERLAVELKICAVGKAAYQRWRGSRVEVPAYFIRWLRLHLERAQDDEGLQSLVDLSWFDAHQGLEGSDVGFREDLRAALWRACLRVLSADDAAARDRAIADHAAALCVQEIIDSQEREVDGQLRAALVQHGLRAEYAALRSLAVLESGWEHQDAARELLPALSDETFRQLVEEASPKKYWPVVAISQRLCAMSEHEEAYHWLAGERAAPFSLAVVAHELAQLPPPWREHLQEKIASDELCKSKREYVLDQVETLISRAVLLPEEAQRVLLERADAMLLGFPEERLCWDEYEGECDPRLPLSEAWCQAQHAERALFWLQRVAAWPFPYAEQERDAQLPEARWARCLVKVTKRTGELPDFARETLSRLSSLEAEVSRCLPPLLPLLPLLSLHERAIAEKALLQKAIESNAPEEHLRAIIEAEVDEATRRMAVSAWVAHVLALCREDRGSEQTYSSQYALSEHVLGALPSLERHLPEDCLEDLFGALWAWSLAYYHPALRGSWVLRCLSSLLRRRPLRAREVYQAWSADPTLAIWYAEAWQEVTPFAERRARLIQECSKRRVRLQPRRWFQLLLPLAKTSPKAAQQLSATIFSLISSEDGHSIAALFEVLQDEAQQALLGQVLALEYKSRDTRSDVLGQVLTRLHNQASQRQLARLMCAQAPERSLHEAPWWFAAALERLPEEERLAAKTLFAPKTKEPEAPAPSAQDWVAYAQWLCWEDTSLSTIERKQKAATFFDTLLQAPKAEDLTWWHALSVLLQVIEIETVLPWLETLVRLPEKRGEPFLYFFLKHGAPEHAAAFVEGASPLARLYLWLEMLAPEERLRELFSRDPEYSLQGRLPDYPWVLERVLKHGRAWEYATLMREAALSTRLAVWRSLWSHLTQVQQGELREDIFAACKEEQEAHDSQEPMQRLSLLPMLTEEQVLVLWSRDGAPSGLGAFPGLFYARLGEEALAAGIARVQEILAETLLESALSPSMSSTDKDEE